MHDGIIRTLSDVWYVPNLKNLISFSIFDSHGFMYFEGVLKILKDALIMLKGKLSHHHYLFQDSTVSNAISVSSLDPVSNSTCLWHMHLDYMSEVGMSLLSKQDLLYGQKIGKLDFYEHYVYGKQCRVKFNIVVHKIKGTLGYIHYDLQDPIHVQSKDGSWYLLIFIDDFLRKVWIYFLEHKKEIFTTFNK